MYILKSRKDKNLYVGSTSDLKKRLKEHSEGKVFSTRSRRPLELIYYEAYKVESEARNREKQLKHRGRARAQLVKRITESLS